MPRYDFFGLGETSVTIAGGGQLDGVTQGDGSHLVGLTITLNNKSFEEIRVRDRVRGDRFFDDNDNDQTTRADVEFDGVQYDNGTIIEAEYTITMLDPNTGIEYQAVGINFNDSSPAYATVEGLAFIDEIPPANVPLTVIAATEGPGDYGQPQLSVDDIAAPPCFTPGTMIRTPGGARAVEHLSVGDMVETVDHGPQPIRWIGKTDVGPFRMAMSPGFRPIRIRKDAFGQGRPARDMLVSPQHRILLEGWQAELLYGEVQVIVAAAHLVDDRRVLQAWDATEITYLHLQFDRHELVFSDGLPTESFNPGPVSLSTIPDASREELQALFPEHDLTTTAPYDAVRPMITRREAVVLNRKPAARPRRRAVIALLRSA